MELGGLGDLLECSVCLEQLSEYNKVLPCQHTFCTQCLKDVMKKKGELLCPECRSKVEVDILALPPNILVNRLLEGMKQSARKSMLAHGPQLTSVGPTPAAALSLTPSTLPLTPSAFPLTPAVLHLTPAGPSLAPSALHLAPSAFPLTTAALPLTPAALPLTPGASKPTNQSQQLSCNNLATAKPTSQHCQILVPTRSPLPPTKPDKPGGMAESAQVVPEVLLDDKCFVTFAPNMYQNITPQPIIKDRGKPIWSGTPTTRASSPPVPMSTTSTNSLNSMMTSSLNSKTTSFNSMMTTSFNSMMTTSFNSMMTTSPNTLMTSSSSSLSPMISSPLPASANIMSPLFQNSSCSPLLSSHASPAHNALPITGNLETNPFLELLDSLPTDFSINTDEPSPIHQPVTNPPKIPNRPAGVNTSVTKEWQLSPRALLQAPTGSDQQMKQSPSGGDAPVKQSSSSNAFSKSTKSSVQKLQQKVIQQQQKHILKQIQQKQQQGLKPAENIRKSFSPTPEWRMSDASQGVSGQSSPVPSHTYRNTSDFESNGHQQHQQQQRQHLFKAMYDYNATQRDELSLKRGSVYVVTEQCQDGWFRGKHLETGSTGVFPGNHLERYHPNSQDDETLIELGDGPETDAERLEKLRKIRETLKKTHAQNIARSHSGAAGHVKSKGERYRCVVPFPSSSDYEIELQIGDVISLVKKREDGWCKGILHRTGKTGLFPLSFVERI